jgi:hypothetical protein
MTSPPVAPAAIATIIVMTDCMREPQKNRWGMLHNHIVFLDKEFLRQAHTICEPRGGYHLGSIAAEYFGAGWAPNSSSLVRTLARKGFDLNQPDKAGRIASQIGLEKGSPSMVIEDLKWAIKHGVDPLKIYPDGHSLLSVDFDTDRDPVLAAQVFALVKRAILKTPAANRAPILEKMSNHPRQVYLPRLSRLQEQLLSASTMPATAKAVPMRL